MSEAARKVCLLKPGNATPTQAPNLNSSDRVVVGCKIPSGFVMELGKHGDDNYVRIQLRGSNSGRTAGGKIVQLVGLEQTQNINGFGLTDVSKDHWDAWCKANKNLTPLKRGFIFALANVDEATAKAIDHSEMRNKLEQIDPAKGLPKKVETANFEND